MIFDGIQEAFFKHEEMPYKLEISRKTYHELMKDSRCMHSSYLADNDGKLRTHLFDCPVHIVNDLDDSYKWLVLKIPNPVKTILL